MADQIYLHYGVRYPGGHISGFEDDGDAAEVETINLLRKGVAVDLVTRKVGNWKRARSQPKVNTKT